MYVLYERYESDKQVTIVPNCQNFQKVRKSQGKICEMRRISCNFQALVAVLFAGQ